jgi:xanthine dehydrogenase accessory factor
MAVNTRDEVWGAVSGGCVEGAVVQVAEEVLDSGEPQLLHFGIADSEAWDVGLPCGGEIDIFVEEYLPLSVQAEFTRVVRERGRAALVTVVCSGDRGPEVGARLLVRADGARDGGLGGPAIDEVAAADAEALMWAERSELRHHDGVGLFVDVTARPPRLVIFGAVDFAGALCRLARAAGWRPYVVDPRRRFATFQRFPEAEAVVAAWPREAFKRLGGIDRATYIAVLTHEPKLDDAILDVALRSDAAYVGAMGSRRANEKRCDRLLAKGMPEELLQRLAAPIGLDLGAMTAEETALSIMAEGVAVRHGREGGQLSRSGAPRIHGVGG